MKSEFIFSLAAFIFCTEKYNFITANNEYAPVFYTEASNKYLN
jgi:hypothetical protein